MSLDHIDVTATTARSLPELPSVNHAGCRSIAPVLARIGDKWSILIIMILSGGPRRFNQLKRTVEGISQRMLTLNLRGMERDGLVTRTVYPSIPPKVEYALTDLGRSLRHPVMALGAWATEHRDTMEAARAAFDAKVDA